MKRFVVVTCALLLLVFVSLGFGSNSHKENSAQEDSKEVPASAAASEDQFAPIDDMHHFMEYISQPSYKALKAALAQEPTERSAWRGIKSHAMILAESSALVARRSPPGATDEQVKQWQQISLDVHKAGQELYKSAGKFDTAKQHFGTMIEHCNKCHQVFDNGKHQLEK